MPSNIRTRFGKARGTPEHYFRVQVSLDGGRSFSDALVMKRDDREGRDKHDRPYRIEWAASEELEREAEAALSRLQARYSAKDTKNVLRKFLRGLPRHYVPSDAEIPVDLGSRIANATFRFESRDGPPDTWEQEADAAALRRAGVVERADNEGGGRMGKLFQWVPWFMELAEKVQKGQREGLVERARAVDWAGGRCAVLAQGEEKADPLTFFYHLAAVAGGKAEKREKVYSSVAEVFEIESNLDYGFDDRFIFPTPPGLAVLFNNTGADPNLFWTLFDQACAVDGTAYDSVNAEAFDSVLQVKGVGVPKLTQVLFLVNPKAFLPFDESGLYTLKVGGFKKTPAMMSWAEYVSEMDGIRTVFPGCEPYELNVIGYLWTSGNLPRKGNRWYQISTSDDGWRDFRDNHWIHQGGLGDANRPGDGNVLSDAEQGYRLDEPGPGDVVLVRAGPRKGRGIGIVYRNDHGERRDRNGRIHMLWVNKKQASLATDIPATRFTRAGRVAYEAFAKSAAYSATMDLLEPPTDSEDPPPAYHALNTILYGPPGTGKTWHTVTRAVAIVESREVSEIEREDRPAVKRRFEEHRNAGRIEMVTFHQNTTYEDFVEGIRPVLRESRGSDVEPSPEHRYAGEVQYEMSRGVFRRIAERAAADPDARYVLIIDEINRGNIARIFGELITLIEDSKRIGRHDEARVTLPGSRTDFAVPANLHVLGTMNTADRSIALLDTALRRRFVFEEMMPKSSHAGIATDLHGVDCGRLLEAMNRRIAVLLDREHQIGHTYFLKVDTLPALAGTFRNRIMPLLQEYFYDDWEKIRAVLNNNGFVLKSDPPEELVRLDLVDADRSVYDLSPDGAERWTDATAYRKIYETAPEAATDLDQAD